MRRDKIKKKIRRRIRESVNNSDVRRQVQMHGREILRSERFGNAKDVPHHFGVSVARHTRHVADKSVKIALFLKKRGVDVNMRDVVRGSLLHDLGMTDRRVFCRPSFVKAYTHPREGVRIAMRDFGVDVDKEVRDAIVHHMWPICVVPPRHITGWIVTAADKAASMEETFGAVRRCLKKFNRRRV